MSFKDVSDYFNCIAFLFFNCIVVCCPGLLWEEELGRNVIVVDDDCDNPLCGRVLELRHTEHSSSMNWPRDPCEVRNVMLEVILDIIRRKSIKEAGGQLAKQEQSHLCLLMIQKPILFQPGLFLIWRRRGNSHFWNRSDFSGGGFYVS